MRIPKIFPKNIDFSGRGGHFEFQLAGCWSEKCDFSPTSRPCSSAINNQKWTNEYFLETYESQLFEGGERNPVPPPWGEGRGTKVGLYFQNYQN